MNQITDEIQPPAILIVTRNRNGKDFFIRGLPILQVEK